MTSGTRSFFGGLAGVVRSPRGARAGDHGVGRRLRRGVLISMKRIILLTSVLVALGAAACGSSSTDVPKCKPNTPHCKQTADHVWVPYAYWLILSRQGHTSTPTYRSSVPDNEAPAHVNVPDSELVHPAPVEEVPHVAPVEVPHVSVGVK